MVNSPFSFYRTPNLTFGAGTLDKVGAIALRHGKTALIVSGKESLKRSGGREALEQSLWQSSIAWTNATVNGEPSPESVDEAVSSCAGKGIELVIAIGGGSVIDAGKAIAAMLPIHDSVLPYMEGGEHHKPHPGTTLPFVAIPTTSGTGSEASSNAVLCRIGNQGFKRSLRHHNFTPVEAIVDPQLMVGCPSAITAACGMDALTQLIESYISTRSTPLTDALVESALPGIIESLLGACSDKAHDLSVRSTLAYAAFISGITLANAGLGVVHGFASSLGGTYPIPHGVICGTLLASATKITLNHLAAEPFPPSVAYKKYARLGEILCKRTIPDIAEASATLVKILEDLTDRLNIPFLDDFGIESSHIDSIAAITNCRNNPVVLTKVELSNILLQRIAH